MAQFTVTLNAKINLPPSAIGVNTIIIEDPDSTHVILVEDVTLDTSPPYTDPEGDGPLNLKVTKLPLAGRGVLYFNAIPVTLNQEISFVDINSGLLTFAPVNYLGQYEEYFEFDISDTGSGQYSGLSTGQLRLYVGEVINLPPSEVGDGSATIEYATTLTFTRVMFTSGTTPPYADPEGDAAYQLKVLSLPVDGLLKLNNINVVINQVINFTDIDAGLFTYVSSLSDIDGDIESFSFSIADEGSNIFVE